MNNIEMMTLNSRYSVPQQASLPPKSPGMFTSKSARNLKVQRISSPQNVFTQFWSSRSSMTPFSKQLSWCTKSTNPNSSSPPRSLTISNNQPSIFSPSQEPLSKNSNTLATPLTLLEDLFLIKRIRKSKIFNNRNNRLWFCRMGRTNFLSWSQLRWGREFQTSRLSKQSLLKLRESISALLLLQIRIALLLSDIRNNIFPGRRSFRALLLISTLPSKF